MKKQAKGKKSKKSASAKAGAELPDLVAVMTKFVERLDSIEKKFDFLNARMTSLPVELKLLIQNHSHPSHFARETHTPPQNSSPQSLSQGKILYEAICADCCKPCKVPFKPREGRPVYCPDCFAIRKAGHVPQDLVSDIKIPPTIGQVKAVPAAASPAAAAEKTVTAKRKPSAKPKKQKRKKK